MILGIPTLRRYDLLLELIESAERGTLRPSKYIVVDNGGSLDARALPKNTTVVNLGKNLGVARSWNLIQELADGAPVVISNDDIILASTVIEEFEAGLQKAIFASSDGFALFGITKECREQVGWFDENFWPAYFEDIDYFRRLKLQGTYQLPVSKPFLHRGSATINKMTTEERRAIDAGYLRNSDYYARKWGGGPNAEAFDTPFDGRLPDGWSERDGARNIGRPMPRMRWDVINTIARKIGATSYLELGCSDGECLRRVDIPKKWGVDPCPHWEAARECKAFFLMPSSDFFKEITGERFDVIFIDSFHEAHSVYDEVRESLLRLTPKGVIVIHDSNPTTKEMQIVPPVQGEWTGDVWRAIVELRNSHHRVFTVNTDYGCGVVVPGVPRALDPWSGKADSLTYEDLDSRRRELLGLVAPTELEESLASQKDR